MQAIKKAKPKNEIAAVIDIGSNELRLKIGQKGKNRLKYIENLSYSLSLGRDTFNSGKISFDKVDKSCDIIRNFLTCAAENGVIPSQVTAIATSAVREAYNRDYILDQIKIKTGVDVRVIDDAEEKIYIYKLMCHLLSEEQKQSALMVYIGSGNIGVSLLDNGKIPFIENIRIGTLRVNELFDDLSEYSSEFYIVVEEYVKSFTNSIGETLANTTENALPGHIRNFVMSGPEIELITELCGGGSITREHLLALYNDIKYKTTNRIVNDYKISLDRAEALLPALCISVNLMAFTEAEEIINPQVFLSDSIIYKMMYPAVFAEIDKNFSKNTLSSAVTIADKYQAHEAHYRLVEKFSLLIFDRLKKIHGLSGRERLLLQVAAILHDIGKFINVRNHNLHCYNIVKGLDITGLNTTEIEIIASIGLYHSGGELIKLASDRNSVLVAKLASILRLADSLDKSQKQKFDLIDTVISDNELVITVATDSNTDLEEWSFNEKRELFMDVFGMKAVFKKKRIT